MSRYANNLVDLALKTNDLIRYQELSIAPLIDNSGGLTDGTLQPTLAALTAVSGAGAGALSKTSADAIFTIWANNVATLTSKVNALSAFYGLPSITDNSTGTVSTTNTLTAIGISGAGVDNTSTAIGVQNTALSSALGSVRDSLSTLAARLNALDDIGSTRPLNVIATM
jgi:hypothetical protein